MLLVDARIGGKGERRFFETKKEAEGWAQLQRVKRQNQGGQAFDDRELSVYGLSVADAIRFTLEHYRRQAASVPIDECVRQMIAAKRATGRSESYLYVINSNLKKVTEHFGNRLMSEITTREIEQFLAGLNLSPGTLNTIRRETVTLWSFAQKAGYVRENAAKASERAKVIDAPPGILLPEQAASLLAESKDDDILAYHSIGLFAGLRTSELKQLDWRDVDLAGRFIHVSSKISKTRSRRLVPILDNLLAWLQPIAKTSGPVAGPLRKRVESARRRAGLAVWPDNAMRHSFVSYRLADTGNAAQTALESGHTQAVLFKHYRELVRPVEAERYFSIRPSGEASDKVLAIA